MTRICAVIAWAALAGCAASGPPVSDAVMAEAKRPLICRDKTQCDLYWSRAQAWVAKNSAYRIQNVSDTVVSTFGPQGYKPELAYQVIREANSDGSARITIKAGCANPIRCDPSPAEAAVSFKRYVTGGQN